VLIVLVLAAMSACASSAPPPTPPPTPALDDVRRVAVVPSGESRFVVVQESEDAGRVLGEVLKWLPYRAILVPIAQAVYAGITSLLERDRATAFAPRDVTPGAVVAEAFARTLQQRGPFQRVVAMGSETGGDARRDADVIVRLAVPSWGLVRVREHPPQVSAFADVRVEMVRRETGVVVWEHEEDVTHPERFSLDALSKDRALVHEVVVNVLERAGRRLANEVVYARSSGR
jgi:hypothetical protein